MRPLTESDLEKARQLGEWFAVIGADIRKCPYRRRGLEAPLARAFRGGFWRCAYQAEIRADESVAVRAG